MWLRYERNLDVSGDESHHDFPRSPVRQPLVGFHQLPDVFSTQRRMQPFPEKILAVSRRLMNTFLAVSENFPAAAGGYRERAVSGPLLSYTPSRMWMRLLAYTFSIKLAQNSFHVSTPAVYVMFLHLIALLAIRIPCDTASSSENLNDDWVLIQTEICVANSISLDWQNRPERTGKTNVPNPEFTTYAFSNTRE